MAETKKYDHLLLAIAYVGFVSLGFPDAVIGVAWPSVRDGFNLDQSSIGFVFFGAGAGYFVSSFFSGRVSASAGIGLLLAVSSGLVAASAFGYSLAPVWTAFALCSILHGLGSGAIDAGLNHYVAHHFAARHMNWLHACYSFGAMLGPMAMTAVLAAGASWRVGYGVIGGTMVLMALAFTSTGKLWGNPNGAETEPPRVRISMRSTIGHSAVQLQMLIFFVYTGLEVTVGQWSFTLLTESRSIEPKVAGMWVSIYWASIGVGRIGFGFVVERVGIHRLLRFCMTAAVAGTMLLANSHWRTGMFLGLALVGLALAPIYPCMMTATPRRLGAGLAAHAIGFQVSAAMFGAAALPTMAGFLAKSRGLEAIAMFGVVLSVVLWLSHEALIHRHREKLPG